MRYARGGTALLALVVAATAAHGQGFFIPGPPPFGGIGRTTRHGSFVFSLSNTGYYASPYPIYPGYPAVVNRVTFVQVSSPPPPVVIVIDGRRGGDDDRPRRLRERDEEREPVEVARGFRPVRPEEPAPARVPPPVPKPRPDDPRPPELPRPPRPEATPNAEAKRLLELGKGAFAAGEYGRAAERFRQAAAADPAEPLARFLLAEADFALGRYDDAADALHVGLRLRPEWPAVAFRPAELYGANVADRLEHLRRLDEARVRHPGDPVLLFLSAYQMWFDGRREEARPLFRKAAAVAPDPSFAERFLRSRPEN